MRDALATVDPAELRPVLHSATRSAIRSKSITVDFGQPFGVVSMDGKYVSVPCVDDRYAQRVSSSDSGTITGRIGTMTASLCSSEARPCIDVCLIPAPTNEMAVLPRALDALLDTYGHLDLFRLVTYDAGACSKASAEHIRSRNLHYLLGLKGSQPQLLYWARFSFKDRLLRRIGYTLLSIFKNVTQRSDHRRQEPWRRLLIRMHCAFGAPSLSLGP